MDKIIKDKALKKTITYRIMAGLGGALIVWVFTGNLVATAGASLAGEAYRSGIYYIHEKAWEGKIKLTHKPITDEEQEAFD